MTLTELRQKHPRLHFQSATSTLLAEGLQLQFGFWLEPDLHFTTTTLIKGVTPEQLEQLPQPVLDWYLFNIGLIESFSYWKLACPAEIVLEVGRLSDQQQAWWQSLLIEGMGEFFFVNQIDFTGDDFVSFKNARKDGSISEYSVKNIVMDQNTQQNINIQNNNKILIPIGGGKDSIVSLEILKKAVSKDRLSLLMLYPTLAAQQVAELSGIPSLRLERHLDPQLNTLNSQGYLNGHTPFSALLAFLTNLTALLFGFNFVAVSNERSSNEGNVMFHDHEINHQYSKTYAFETVFRDYVDTYGPDHAPNYFSYMRPLYELQIAELFSQMTEYHDIFRSCNVGRQTNEWCGHCAKCLFVYLMLSALMPPAAVEKIFGQNLLANLELKHLALELLGYAEQKPLECVGTHEESRAAAYLAARQYQDAGQDVPALLEVLTNEYLSQEPDLATRAREILTAWNPEHQVPKELELILKTALNQVTHA